MYVQRMYVGMCVWYLELSREPRHVAQRIRYQSVGLRNGHCLGTISLGCDFYPALENAKISSAQSKNACEYWQHPTLNSEDKLLQKKIDGIASV